MGRIELPSTVYETVALPLSYIGVYAVISFSILLKRNLLGDYSHGCLPRVSNQSPARTKQFALAH